MVTIVDAPALQARRPGSGSRPWFHALAAGVYALLVSVTAPAVVVPFVWWGDLAFVAAIVVAAVGACLVGRLLAGAFVRPRAAWLVGCLGVIPALALPVISAGYPVATPGYVVVGLAGASSALLAHPRSARTTGLALGAVAFLVAGGSLVGAGEAASLDAAEQRFGTDVAPYVTSVAGFERVAATATPMTGVALTYRSDDAEFLLSTETLRTDDMVTAADQVCILPLDVVALYAEPDALSCEPSADGWTRLSESRREVAIVVDGVIVRAGAELSVDETVLRAAITRVSPIEDAAYRELLDAGAYSTG